MQERERILELVKKGILSTEEALDLLENLAKKESREAAQKEYSKVEKETLETEPAAEEEPVTEEDEERIDIDKVLEELANEASSYSVELDRLEKEMNDVESQLTEAEEELLEIGAMEDLDGMDAAKEARKETLKSQIKDLEARYEALKTEHDELMKKLHNVKMKQWSTQAKRFVKNVDIPSDWKENASETVGQVGEKVAQAGTEFAKVMKGTLDSVMENVDWKDVNVRIPSVATKKFSHEFVYPASTASILDFKIANGNVTFKQAEDDAIRIDANIKLYGKMETEDAFQAFQRRSAVKETEDTLQFHVPNKRVRIDMTVYLPKRTYDYTAVHMLNGNVTFDNFNGKDVYVKSTNGKLAFNNSEAVMLETKGTNGNVALVDSKLRDLLISNINGDIIIRGEVTSSNVATVNGTVRVTLTGDDLIRLDATSVNGRVKVAVPHELDVEAEVRTNFGKIYNRMQDIEVVDERKERTNQALRFRRIRKGEAFQLTAGTTAGSVLLKDTDK